MKGKSLNGAECEAISFCYEETIGQLARIITSVYIPSIIPNEHLIEAAMLGFVGRINSGSVYASKCDWWGLVCLNASL